ncbi:MAG: hypothetical protein IPM23_20905 [Candidatus Melainabacteria bacterium]|nr:hypothetical protein [Candidatus Melainabacteria bacterium]
MPAKLLSIALAFLLAVSLQPAGFASEAKVKAITVRQISSGLGNLEVFIARSAIRVNCVRGNCIVVGKAPDWQALVYNRKDGTGRLIDRVSWVGDGLKLGGFKKPFKRRKLAIKRLHKMGLPMLTVSVRVTHSGSGINGIFRSGRRDDIPALRANLTCIDGLGLNAGQKDFLRGLYQSPPIGEVPFEMSYTRPGGKLDVQLRTVAWKQVEVPESIFRDDYKFKIAPSVEAIVLGNQFESMMDDLLGPAPEHR